MTFQNLCYALEFAPVWAADKLLSALPRPVCIKFGEWLGLFVSCFFSKRNQLMRDNLEKTFPEKSVAEREAIRRAVWRNIGRVAAEFIRLSEINRESFQSKLTLEGKDLLEKADRQGKGIVLVGFHFTNWEVTGVGGDLFHRGRIMAVARPIKNPLVQRWVLKKRGSGGMNTILHRAAVKGTLKGLKEKKAVGILVDQNLYTGGVFADFLGRPAATTTLPALLHARTGAPVLLLYALRSGNQFRIIFEEIPGLDEAKQKESPILAMTEAINRHLGTIIRRYPENWFWVHNRWKRQPE